MLLPLSLTGDSAIDRVSFETLPYSLTVGVAYTFFESAIGRPLSFFSWLITNTSDGFPIRYHAIAGST
jgi:hypothetical protein